MNHNYGYEKRYQRPAIPKGSSIAPLSSQQGGGVDHITIKDRGDDYDLRAKAKWSPQVAPTTSEGGVKG